eukprot:TRINITY_DN52007_c0_g1_i1.p1 TRINITY_DN52007_c0_g1~~TRINITY_DN52007_c0_g1_i1.p1  ORF type:complete len:654 (+),score=59.24 TRINITY_DN52007_c0_g1_i1:36-1964(+)
MASGRLMVISDHLNHNNTHRKNAWKHFLLRCNEVSPTDLNISPRGVLIYNYSARLFEFLPLSEAMNEWFLNVAKTENKRRILEEYERVWALAISHTNALQAMNVLDDETFSVVIDRLKLEVDFFICPAIVEGSNHQMRIAVDKARIPTLFPQTLLHRLLRLVDEVTTGSINQGHFYYQQRKLANTVANSMLAAMQPSMATLPPSMRSQPVGDIPKLQQTVWSGMLYNALHSACVKVEWDVTQVASAPFIQLPKGELQGDFDRLVKPLCEVDKKTGRLVKKTVMYIVDRAGEIMFDLRLVDTIVDIGHRVVVVVNREEVFETVTMADFSHDETLKAWARQPGRQIIEKDIPLLHRHIYENELSACVIARSEPGIKHHTFDIFKASNNFFRAARMAELILCKKRHQTTLGSLDVTRDIYWLEHDAGKAVLSTKIANTKSSLITRDYIDSKATHFLKFLRTRKSQGWKVVFGSVIIGSLGESQVSTCIKISKAMEEKFKHSICYKRHLRAYKNVFYINPAVGYTDTDGIFHKFFEAGFDGDAMMEFWSQVQMSGLIDVWKFQSREDIVTYFENLPDKERPDSWQDFWADKNWTWSKGCCQEMLIARQVKAQISPQMIIYCDDDATLQLTDKALQDRSYYHIGSIS